MFLTTTAICIICFYCLLVLKLIQGLNWLTVSLNFVDMRYTTLAKKKYLYCRADAEEKYGKALMKLSESAKGRDEIG